MRVLCIQIHPSRAPGINIAIVRDAAAQLGSSELIARFCVEEDADDGAYINLYFDTPPPAEARQLIRSALYADSRIGAMLAKSSIVTCQGHKGWNDYLLLHHFDPQPSRDQL